MTRRTRFALGVFAWTLVYLFFLACGVAIGFALRVIYELWRTQ